MEKLYAVDVFMHPFMIIMVTRLKRNVPFAESEEVMKRMQKRVEVGDAQAIYQLGVCYSQGMYGLSQDYAKALELWHRAEELGCAAACCNIGYAYSRGEGVEGRTLLQTRTIPLQRLGTILVYLRRKQTIMTGLRNTFWLQWWFVIFKKCICVCFGPS